MLKTQPSTSTITSTTPTHYGPSKVVVTDHRRNDHKSEIVFTRVKLNQGLKDDFFTQRTLIRGH